MPHFNEYKAATSVGAEGVKATNIEAEAITAPKAKKPQILVASGTESLTAEVGTAGVSRMVVAVYNAKAEASAKVKIKHGLGTEYVTVEAWKASAKKATEKITPDGAAIAGAIAKVKMVSNEEIELTLVASVPAGKEELFYIIQG